VDKLDKKWSKLKAYITNNDHCNVEIHRQGDSIVWKMQICESDSLTIRDITAKIEKT